jgi:hypothetical protein
MPQEPTTHVKPILIWQFACGGQKFSHNDYLHLMICAECETLADEITEALSDIEKTLSRARLYTGAS